MRSVLRSLPAPFDLVEKGEAERLDAITHYEATPPGKGSHSFKRYKLDSVKLTLEKLFHGKCAYCETFYASAHPLDVEHYRPKGAVEGEETHRGYWWLAADWDNLLPSCIDCNRKRRQLLPLGDPETAQLNGNQARFVDQTLLLAGKKDSFPLAPTGQRARERGDNIALEHPLLLHPCIDRPDEHLRFFFDEQRAISLVLAANYVDAPYADADGLSIKGTASIQVFGLNRLRLVQARTRLLRNLEFLAGLVIGLNHMADELEGKEDDSLKPMLSQLRGFADTTLGELVSMTAPERPYSAMAVAWLQGFKKRLEGP